MDKKYIVTLADEYALVHKLTVPVTINGKHTAWIQTDINLTPYTEPDMEQVRKEAYDKGYDDATAEIGSDEQAIAEKAYQKGLSDAWEAARKIQDTGGNLNWWIHNTSASEAIEKIRQYEQEKEERDRGYEDGYHQGLSDAWKAVRKIIKMPEGDLLNIFTECYSAVCTALQVILKYDAPEAIEKIRQYEQEKEEQIQVGDEVIPRETEYDTMIVTRLWKDDYDSDCIDAIGFDGRISSFLVSRVSKTGKHHEIAEVLAKMKKS